MNAIRNVAVLAIATLLSACATQGDPQKIKATLPDGEVLTIVAHPQSVPDWMLDGSTLKANFMVKGDVTPRQLAAVAEIEKMCRIYTGTVRPSNLVAAVSSGVLYGIAGFIGVGLGSQAFAGAVFSEYARYGGAASGFAGAANGVISSAGQTYTFENCTTTALGKVLQYGVSGLNRSPY